MRTVTLRTTSILMSASFVLAGSEAPRSRALGKPSAEVPFTLHQNAVILKATINGRDEVRLLLDTGWGPLALISTAAKRLHLQPKGPKGEYLRVEVKSLAI